MGLRLSTTQFADWAEPLRPTFESLAFHSCRNHDDAVDIVQDVFTHALLNLGLFDGASGVDGLSRWLNTILMWRLGFYRRAKDRDARVMEDARWALITERDDCPDVELRNEAILRLRLTNLTELQVICLAGRLRGVKAKVTARDLHITESTVNDHIRAAVKKLRACPVDVIEEADIDAFSWRARGKVSVYHAPTKTGSGLAKMTPSQRRLNSM